MWRDFALCVCGVDSDGNPGSRRKGQWVKGDTQAEVRELWENKISQCRDENPHSAYQLYFACLN